MEAIGWISVWNQTIMSRLHIPQPAPSQTPPPPNFPPRPIPKPLMRYREVMLNLGAHSFIITHDMLKWARLNMCRSGVGTFRRNTLPHAQKHTLPTPLSLSLTHRQTQAGWVEGGGGDQRGESSRHPLFNTKLHRESCWWETPGNRCGSLANSSILFLSSTPSVFRTFTRQMCYFCHRIFFI